MSSDTIAALYVSCCTANKFGIEWSFTRMTFDPDSITLGSCFDVDCLKFQLRLNYSTTCIDKTREREKKTVNFTCRASRTNRLSLLLYYMERPFPEASIKNKQPEDVWNAMLFLCPLKLWTAPEIIRAFIKT